MEKNTVILGVLVVSALVVMAAASMTHLKDDSTSITGAIVAIGEPVPGELPNIGFDLIVEEVEVECGEAGEEDEIDFEGALLLTEPIVGNTFIMSVDLDGITSVEAQLGCEISGDLISCEMEDAILEASIKGQNIPGGSLEAEVEAELVGLVAPGSCAGVKGDVTPLPVTVTVIDNTPVPKSATTTIPLEVKKTGKAKEFESE